MMMDGKFMVMDFVKTCNYNTGNAGFLFSEDIRNLLLFYISVCFFNYEMMLDFCSVNVSEVADYKLIVIVAACNSVFFNSGIMIIRI